MDCRGVRAEALSRPLFPLFRGELWVCIPNEHIGWRSALHNQQTLTSKEPKGASSSYGWTCPTNPMSSQKASSYTSTSCRRRGRWKRHAERKNETEWGGSVRPRESECTFLRQSKAAV